LPHMPRLRAQPFRQSPPHGHQHHHVMNGKIGVIGSLSLVSPVVPVSVTTRP
jgi:hypothetical protein